MTGTFAKRAGAYLLDMIIVSLIVMLLSYIPFLNPNHEAYTEKYNELVNVYEQFQNNEISEEEYNEAAIPISYELYRLNIPSTIIDLVCVIIYSGVLPFFCAGQTIGKKLFQVRIVSANDKPLTLGNFLLRSVILNNVLISIGLIAVILFMDAGNYYTVYQNLNMVGYIIMYIILFMVLVRQDNRGLHDFIANTKVVFTNEEIEKRLEKIEEEQKVLESELEKTSKKKEKVVKAKTTETKKKTKKTIEKKNKKET